MNICFIANFNKTYFFHEIAKILREKYQIETYWIIFNHSIYDFLKKETTNILYLPKEEILNKDSKPIGEFKLNELVFGDRIFKYSYKKGIRYLTNTQEPIYNFIKSNKIKYIFGEITWAHEILIHRITKYCPELGCTFLNPHTIRIPGGRFAFFKDEFQSEILEINPDYTNQDYPKDAFTPKKPDYLLLNDKILKKNNSIEGRLSRLKRFITSENLDKNDVTLPEQRTLNRVMNPFRNELYKETYKFLTKLDLDFVKNKKFIFLTLHKQPEASIDVLGRYMEDQTLNIINIWKQLPTDWWLVVKEHTNAIGDRPLKFYKRLLKYDKIIFIDERVDSYSLLEYCQAVVTVSGTVAYEAALMKKKALVLCDVFFNFSYVKKITLEELKYARNIVEILDSIPRNVDDEDKKKYIYANSFEGVISDPISNPKCIEMDNIDNIAKVISSLK